VSDVSLVCSDEAESVLIAGGTTRWCRQVATGITTGCCCCYDVKRTVVKWVHRNIIVLATTAWLESLCCQWGRVVVVVDCSAVECDDFQRPTRDLHCPLTSDEATWRQWMISVDDQWHLLHSPTHTHQHMLTDTLSVGNTAQNFRYVYGIPLYFYCLILMQLVQCRIYKSPVRPKWIQLILCTKIICHTYETDCQKLTNNYGFTQTLGILTYC